MRLRRWWGSGAVGAPRFRIATVYRRDGLDDVPEHSWDIVWWKRISEGFAERGHSVDVIAGRSGRIRALRPHLRSVPFPRVDWPAYDVVLAFFHRGFSNVMDAGGHHHPFLLTSLASVVGGRDDIPGVYFRGGERTWLYGVQERVAEHSRCVGVLTEASRTLWHQEHGRQPPTHVIPGGVDCHVTAPGRSPYAAYREPVAAYIGYI